MSTAMFTGRDLREDARLVPGRSGTPAIVMRASFLVERRAADRLVGCFGLGDDHRARLVGEAACGTWIGTPNFLANSIERLCITPAPRLASSSISS